MNTGEPELQCARCSVAISSAGAYWTEHGQICGACETRELLQASFLKAYRSSGFGSLAAGFVGQLFNPFLIFTILSLSSAVWAFKSAATNDPVEREVARENRGPLIAGIFGMLLGILQIVRILGFLPL
jgi:hypothetical protein